MNNYTEKFNDYLANKKNLTDNTISAYLRDIKSFKDYILLNYNKDLLLVNKTMILTYLLDMQKKSKNASTVSRSLSSIKSFFSFLENEGAIIKNPSNGVHAPKIQQKSPEFLTINEIEKLLNVPDTETHKGSRDRAMLELLYSTGIKASELLNLKIYDYNKNTESIKINSSNNFRHVPVGSVAKKYLEFYLGNHRNPLLVDSSNDTLFVNVSGNYMTRQGFWKIVRFYAKKANINKNITPQIIRNSFVIHLMQNGVDINTLQTLFGQESISAIQAYNANKEKRTFEIFKKNHPRA